MKQETVAETPVFMLKEEMVKEEIVKDDGRTLIYYTFPAENQTDDQNRRGTEHHV